MSEEYEGWSVRARPAVIAILVFLVGLVALVSAAGAVYKTIFAQQTRPYITIRQHPALETVDTAPSDKAQLAPPEPPRAVGAAMAQVAAEGDALWNEGR